MQLTSLVPAAVGNIPQYGQLAVLLAIFAVVLRYLPPLLKVLPEMVRALSERARDRVTRVASETAAWQEIEARVSAELEECRRGREEEGRWRAYFSEKSFRQDLVIAMLLDDVERLDPGSQAMSKAKALMAVPLPAPEPPDLNAGTLEAIADLIRDPAPEAGRAQEGRHK